MKVYYLPILKIRLHHRWWKCWHRTVGDSEWWRWYQQSKCRRPSHTLHRSNFPVMMCRRRTNHHCMPHWSPPSKNLSFIWTAEHT
jgi:hypothetical protein